MYVVSSRTLITILQSGHFNLRTSRITSGLMTTYSVLIPVYFKCVSGRKAFTLSLTPPLLTLQLFYFMQCFTAFGFISSDDAAIITTGRQNLGLLVRKGLSSFVGGVKIDVQSDEGWNAKRKE